MEILEILNLIETKKIKKQLIRMHPYGFLQLSLTDTEHWRDSGYRLHVWSKKLPPMLRPEFAVHDHIYDVKSKLLFGSLEDIIYEVKENSAGKSRLYFAEGGHLNSTEILVDSSVVQSRIIKAGEEYTILQKAFHSTVNLAPLTVTLFQKVNADLRLSPRIIGPKSYQGELSDARVFDQSRAWEVLDLVVKEIKINYGY